MFNFSLLNSFNKKEVILFTILYLSLLISFIIGENSTGGAILDYANQKKASQAFADNFLKTFLNYDNFGTRHSPLLIIFLSFFEKLNIQDNIIRLIHLHLSLLLPLSFGLILKAKYKFIDTKSILILVGIIFLSPTFRSLSIWPDSRILGLAVFCLSIYFFLRFQNTSKYKYCILNVCLCILSSYISPNFAVFSIYFFYKFFIFYKNSPSRYLFIIFINLIFALPFLYYVLILDVNFLNQSAATNFDGNTIFFVNLFNNFSLISSILVFYLLPFLLTKVIQINTKLEISKLILALIISLIAFYYFDYRYEYTGGGIFFKISYFFFKNNYLFYLLCFISIFILLKIFQINYENIFLFFLILINNPQVTVYHKYYDPFLMVVFFSLLSLKTDINRLKTNLNVIIIYLFFFIFLIINNIKFLWTI